MREGISRRPNWVMVDSVQWAESHAGTAVADRSLGNTTLVLALNLPVLG